LQNFSAIQEFWYDDADQLDSARANSGNLYNVKMVYGNYGRINASNTTFTDPQTNILQQYNNNYTYNTVNPQSNSFAAESANNNNIMFEYGNNGSLRKRTDNALQKTEYYLFNAFDQMKAYSENGETYGYYGYDDAGQRTYKATLKNFVSRTNALGGKTLEVEKMMLYPNGYININQDGNYTKHYYADAARIASKIGNGFIDTANLYYSSTSSDSVMLKELTELTGDTIESIDNKYDSLWLQIDTGEYENALYFYHGNNLSSTQLITDMYGTVSQAVLYAPFGQIISSYNPTDWQNGIVPEYMFNAKEYDEESGLYYYEARYYDPDKNIFNSRDALFEKKPFMSAYAYCRNNPVKYIDPSGEDEYEVDMVNQTITVKAGTKGTDDRFTIIKADGTTVTSNSYANGTISQLENSSVEGVGVTGDKNGKEMFEFLAQNSGVEWNWLQTGKAGEADGTNYLFTIFDAGKVKYDPNVLNGEIRVDTHNHPSGSTTPSDGDNKQLLTGQTYNYQLNGRMPDKGSTHRMPASYIYTNDGRYTPYDPPTKALYDNMNKIRNEFKNEFKNTTKNLKP